MGGYKIRRVFFQINIFKRNYSIMRIGLVGASEVFKNQSLKVNHFHLPLKTVSGLKFQKKMYTSGKIFFRIDLLPNVIIH